MSANSTLNFNILARDKASPVFNKFGREVKQSEKHTRGLSSGLGTLAKGFAALAVVSKATEFLKESIVAGREAQKTDAQTAAVIKSTGGAAKVTAKQFDELARSISIKTGIDKVQIQASENMLATFTNVRNEAGKGNDIFTQATKRTNDLAVAMKLGPAKAALQVGKALNDPIKGLGRLQRIGVTFTDQQKKQVAEMVKVGNTAGAQKVILKELAKEFGGSAKAQATAADKARNAMHLLKEQIGTALLPIIDKLQNWIANKLVPAVSGFIKQMQDGTGWGGKIADVLGKVGTVLGVVFTWIGDHKAETAAFVGTVIAMAGAFALVNAVLAINPFTILVVGIAVLAGWFVHLYKTSDSFRQHVDTLWNTVLKPFGKWLAAKLPGAMRAVGLAMLEMVRVAVTAFHFLLRVVFFVFDHILRAAAKAFGWIPKIGPKIKAASKAFTGMRTATNDALTAVENKLKDTHNKLDSLGRAKAHPRVKLDTSSFTSSAAYVFRTISRIGAAASTASSPSLKVSAYAVGTISATRGMALVGEHGPELVSMRGGEHVYTNRQSMAMMGGGGGADFGTVTVVVVADDGRELQRKLLTVKRTSGGRALGLA